MEGIGADLEVMKRLSLAAGHIDAIRAIGRERSYGAGDMIARIGDPMDRFLYVVEGEIEVLDPYSEKRLGDATLGPGQFGGDLSFLSGQRRLPGPGKQVDARGEHGLDGVRHEEIRRELTERPAAVPRASTPRSASVAISSSAKNGFPSARSATSSRIGAGQPLPSSASANCSASAPGSASSRSSDAPAGPAQPGR